MWVSWSAPSAGLRRTAAPRMEMKAQRCGATTTVWLWEVAFDPAENLAVRTWRRKKRKMMMTRRRLNQMETTAPKGEAPRRRRWPKLDRRGSVPEGSKPMPGSDLGCTGWTMLWITSAEWCHATPKLRNCQRSRPYAWHAITFGLFLRCWRMVSPQRVMGLWRCCAKDCLSPPVTLWLAAYSLDPPLWFSTTLRTSVEVRELATLWVGIHSATHPQDFPAHPMDPWKHPTSFTWRDSKHLRSTTPPLTSAAAARLRMTDPSLPPSASAVTLPWSRSLLHMNQRGTTHPTLVNMPTTSQPTTSPFPQLVAYQVGLSLTQSFKLLVTSYLWMWPLSHSLPLTWSLLRWAPSKT